MNQVEIFIEEEYSCQILDNRLLAIDTNCSRSVSAGTELVWEFKDGCGWNIDEGYYCEVRANR